MGNIKNILLVEDYSLDVELIHRAFLENKNYDIIVKSCIKEAKNHLINNRVDLIITDWFLKDGEGTELLPGDYNKNEYPVILMTGQGNEEMAAKAFRLGASDYIVKKFENYLSLPFIIERVLREWTNNINRAKAEEQIRRNEKQLEIIFRQSPTVICIIDKSSTEFVMINNSFKNSTGYTEQEVIGNKFDEVKLFSDIKERELLINEGFLSKEIKNLELKFQIKSGAVIWGMLSSVPIIYNGVECILSLISDITSKKLYEIELINYRIKLEKKVDSRTLELDKTIHQLKNEIIEKEIIKSSLDRSMNFTNKIINSIAEPIFVIDKYSELILFNESLCSLFGLKPEDTINNLKKLSKEKKELNLLLKENDKIFKYGNDYSGEEYFFDQEGHNRFIFTHKTLYKDDTGEKFIVGIISDLSKRKEAEEEISNALIKEKELNELKSRFVSMVSHEYRTPLTAIMSSAELLQMFSHKWDKEKRDDLLIKIQEKVEYLTTLIDDVLLFNILDTNKYSIKIVSIEIISFVENLLDEIRVTLKNDMNIIFTTNVTEQIIESDKKSLLQIFTNLTTNAIKYSHDSDDIKIELIIANRDIIFSVEDYGFGIPEEDKVTLFDPFVRGRNIANIPGSGLGLPIVKRSLNILNGDISFVSKENVGTKFTVKIPF